MPSVDSAPSDWHYLLTTTKSNLTKYGFCKQFFKLKIDEMYIKLAWDNILLDVAYYQHGLYPSN